LAGIIVLFIASAASVRYPGMPLPDGLRSAANWDKDTVYFLSLSGEAKWHWPLVDPEVSGLPFYYHYLSYIDMGAMSRLTGIDLSELLLRVDVVVPHILVTLVIAVAGRSLSGRWSVGVLAAVLVMLLGEWDLDPIADKTFRGHFAELERDTSFHYGVMFGVGALVMMAERLGITARRAPPGRGDWMLLALMLFAAGGSKAPMICVLIGGLGLWMLLRLLGRRWPTAVEWKLTAMLVGGLVVGVLITYPRQSAGHGLELRFGAVFDKMGALYAAGLRPATLVPDVLAWPVSIGVGLFGMLGMAAVGVVIGRRWGDDLDGRLRTLLLCTFTAGLVCTASTMQGGNSEEYFLWCGYPALALAAAPALDRFVRQRLSERTARIAFASALAAALVLGLAFAVALDGFAHPGPLGLGWLPALLVARGPAIAPFVLGAIVVGFVCLAVAPAPIGGQAGGRDAWRATPRATVAVLAFGVLLGALVVASADRIAPWALETATDRPYREILPSHIRIAFALWSIGLVAVLAAAWWRLADRVELRAARSTLLAAAALTVLLAPAEDARVPFADALATLGPFVLVPLLTVLAWLGAPALRERLPRLRIDRVRQATTNLRFQPARTALVAVGAVLIAFAGAVVAAELAGTVSGAALLGGVVAAAAFVAASRRLADLAATIAVAVTLAPALLDMPVDILAPVYYRAFDPPPEPTPDLRLLTPGIAEAMRWLRDHSDPDDVLVVNNQHEDAGRQDARYFFYSALAERRTYLGGWLYSPVTSAELDARQRGTSAALCGDRAALERLYRDAHVRWVVVDKVHEAPLSPRPENLPRAFSNADVDLYRVDPRRLEDLPASACRTPP
jgi:hypothetical protein